MHGRKNDAIKGIDFGRIVKVGCLWQRKAAVSGTIPSAGYLTSIGMVEKIWRAVACAKDL